MNPKALFVVLEYVDNSIGAMSWRQSRAAEYSAAQVEVYVDGGRDRLDRKNDLIASAIVSHRSQCA